MHLAFYQPEIPQNTGTIIRLCACLGISLDIIHPCGFIWQDRYLRRAGMDYMDIAIVHHHTNWKSFYQWVQNESHRLVLLDTKAAVSYTDYAFKERDILLLGQESSGVPEDIYHTIDERLSIPMVPYCRSLNVALAAAMVVGEGLRQLNSKKR